MWFHEAITAETHRVASLTEQHWGILVTDDAHERARLAVEVARRGGEPRRRQIDLAIAATAQVEGVPLPLLTNDLADFEIIKDLVDVRQP